jgi:hypothetical protein
METPVDPPADQPRLPIDLAAARAARGFTELESSFGPLEEHEREFYEHLGDMGTPPDTDAAPEWDQLEGGLPAPDDPDAEASGAVWTGQFWRPKGRPATPPHSRTPMCPNDFVMMEFTNVGWVCPDCGLARI